MNEIFVNYIQQKLPHADVFATNTFDELINTININKKNSIIIIILDIYLEDDISLYHLNLLKATKSNLGVIIHTGSNMKDKEILNYTNAINLPFSIIHKPSSLKNLQDNISNILQMLGCINILIINEDSSKANIIKNIIDKKNYMASVVENIIEAKNYLYRMYNSPLLIFMSTKIINTLSKELIDEFNNINSFVCKTDDFLINKIFENSLNIDISISQISSDSVNNVLLTSINNYTYL